MRIFLFLFFLSSVFCGFAQITIEGIIADLKTNQPIDSCQITVYQDSTLLTATVTDTVGYYSLSLAAETQVDLLVQAEEYQSLKLTEVMLSTSGNSYLDAIWLRPNADFNTWEIPYDSIKVAKGMQQLEVYKQTKMILNLPTRDISNLAIATSVDSSVKHSEEIKIRGSRNTATYYPDGPRINAQKRNKLGSRIKNWWNRIWH